MNNEEIEGLIVDYCLNKLPGEKMDLVEERMIASKKFRDKVLAMEMLLGVLKEKGVTGVFAEQGVDFNDYLEKRLKDKGELKHYEKILKSIKQHGQLDLKEKPKAGLIKPREKSKLTELDKFFQKLKQFIEFPVSATQQPAAIIQSFGKTEDFLSGALNKTNQGFINEILQMRTFNRDEKTILEMSLFNNMKTGEIARKLNEDPKAISRKKSRALKKLQNEFLEIYGKEK